VHVTKVGAVFALLLRGADAEEMHVGEFGGGVVVGREAQSTGSDIVAQHLSQAGLIERDVAGRELGDLSRIDVDADHVVPELGHACRMGSAEITRAEDCASHTCLSRRPR
jgi:hypothetical protein